MTAISKAWITIADTAVDPDSPIDTTLMTGLRDDLVYLREWLGASYIAGAVQDHSHDGVNSALVPIGPNYLRNGSFESGTSGWTITQYTGGTVATSATTPLDGAASLAFTSTVLANGGGDAVSNEYIPVSGGVGYPLNGVVQASVANVSGKAEIIWYDNTKAQISISAAYSSANLPTALTPIGGLIAAPSNARFMRLKITGGVPSVGSATGTVYFDGLVVANSTVPTGTIIDFSGTTPPVGYLTCPTAATNISRTTYAALFAAIGTTWGAGDGTTTFGLPWFAANYTAVQASANVGTSTVGDVISHAHSAVPASNGGGTSGGYATGSSAGSGGANTGAAGGAANLAAGVRVLKCVKY